MFRWFQKLSNKRFRAYNESLVLYYKVSQDDIHVPCFPQNFHTASKGMGEVCWWVSSVSECIPRIVIYFEMVHEIRSWFDHIILRQWSQERVQLRSWGGRSYNILSTTYQIRLDDLYFKLTAATIHVSDCFALICHEQQKLLATSFKLRRAQI